MNPNILRISTIFVLLIPWDRCADGVILESAVVAETVEIIGVVRLGVSLVEYIYKGM